MFASSRHAADTAALQTKVLLYLHQFRGQHAHTVGASPLKSLCVVTLAAGRCGCRRGFQENSSRPAGVAFMFYTPRRGSQRLHFIQGDQRHLAVSPDTPAAWQTSTCKRKRQKPCPSSRSKNGMSLFCSVLQKSSATRGNTRCARFSPKTLPLLLAQRGGGSLG